MVAALVPVDGWECSGDELTLGRRHGGREQIGPARTTPLQGGASDPQSYEARQDIDGRARWLLRALALGHSEAFWDIWELYRDDLYKLCLKAMGGVREDAEDAQSLAMLRARDRLPVYALEIRNIRGWLWKLTANLCIDLYRERLREATCIDALHRLASLGLVCTPGPESPESRLLLSEIRDHLDRAIESLPRHLYDPFRLYFLFDMTYTSIGRRLGIAPTQARKHIERALIVLKGRLRWLGCSTLVTNTNPGSALQRAI